MIANNDEPTHITVAGEDSAGVKSKRTIRALVDHLGVVSSQAVIRRQPLI